MSEVRFRYKRKDTDNWCYSKIDYLNERYGNSIIYTHGTDFSDGTIDPETIGRWARIEDKNCVPVYEGDIIECKGCKYEVIYKNHHFCLSQGQDMPLCTFNEVDFKDNNWKIIGNIHDNPELKMVSNEML